MISSFGNKRSEMGVSCFASGYGAAMIFISAMHFVLTADQRLLSGSCSADTEEEGQDLHMTPAAAP